MIVAHKSVRAAAVMLRLAGVMLAVQFAAGLAPQSALANECRPRRPLPSVILRTMGPCDFNLDTMSFAGDSVQQAACLIRPVNRWAHLGPPLQNLPKALADRVGT